jgi:group I intron endonuclease
MFIYKITNLINNKIYIGQSRYKNDNYFGSGVNIKNAIEEYGKNNFVKEYIDEAFNQLELDEKEKYWIKITDAQNPIIGYNIADGGWNHLTITEDIKKKISKTIKEKYINGYVNNRLGCSISNETKKKISNSNKGKVLSEETKKKISNSNKGKVLSEETRKKISDIKKNTKLSESHKNSISESLKGRPVSSDTRNKLRENNINKTQKHSKQVTAINLITNEVLTFNNISQAARELCTYRSYVRNNKVNGFNIHLK